MNFAALLRKIFALPEPPPPALPPWPRALPVISAEPDAPSNMGYKSSWFAIRSESPEAVAAALGLAEVQPANWASGTDFACWRADDAKRYVPIFVTPPLQGWVLAIGASLPFLDELEENGPRRRAFLAMIDKTASCFEEFQFFGTYRVCGYDCWVKVKNGAIERLFSIADSQIYANIGAQTPEEHGLNLMDFGERDAEAAMDYWSEVKSQEITEFTEFVDDDGSPETDLLPGEDDTMALAGAWSIDPSTLQDAGLPPSVGLIGYMDCSSQVEAVSIARRA